MAKECYIIERNVWSRDLTGERLYDLDCCVLGACRTFRKAKKLCEARAAAWSPTYVFRWEGNEYRGVLSEGHFERGVEYVISKKPFR